MSPILISTIFILWYTTLSNVVKASLNSSNCNSESFSAILNLLFIGACSIYTYGIYVFDHRFLYIKYGLLAFFLFAFQLKYFFRTETTHLSVLEGQLDTDSSFLNVIGYTCNHLGCRKKNIHMHSTLFYSS